MASGGAWLAAGAGVAALGVVAALTRKASCPAGQLAIQLIAQGPGTISAGGSATTRRTITICPHSGAQVQYQATPDAGHTFARFEGPNGVSTTQNPFTATSDGPGFVRAVFQ